MSGPVLLADSVYQRIRAQILAGELQPGDNLSVPALAARLEVSRSPVRESVQQLINEGLAVNVAYAGARVVELDDDAVRSVFEVREVLEGLAARQAALRLTIAELAELRVLAHQQQTLVTADRDNRRDALLDLQFHAYIRDRAGNNPLRDALSRLQAQSHLHRSAMWSHPLNRRLAAAEHLQIVQALEAGEPDAAAQAAGAHVAGLLVRMTRQ